MQDYVRDKLTKEAEALELSVSAIPSLKPAKAKPVKKAAPASSCDCCPKSSPVLNASSIMSSFDAIVHQGLFILNLTGVTK